MMLRQQLANRFVLVWLVASTAIRAIAPFEGEANLLKRPGQAASFRAGDRPAKTPFLVGSEGNSLCKLCRPERVKFVRVSPSRLPTTIAIVAGHTVRHAAGMVLHDLQTITLQSDCVRLQV